MTTRLNVAKFIAAIEDSKGIKARICEKVPCTFNTLTSWMAKHPTILVAYNTECARMLGMAVSVITTNIELAQAKQKEGEVADSSDAKWYASRKGRHEGYGTEEATNITVNAGFSLSDWRKHAKEQLAQVKDL